MFIYIREDLSRPWEQIYLRKEWDFNHRRWHPHDTSRPRIHGSSPRTCTNSWLCWVFQQQRQCNSDQEMGNMLYVLPYIRTFTRQMHCEDWVWTPKASMPEETALRLVGSPIYLPRSLMNWAMYGVRCSPTAARAKVTLAKRSQKVEISILQRLQSPNEAISRPDR